MSQALAQANPGANQRSTRVIFSNQLRMKIGVLLGTPRPPGWNALKFYAACALIWRRWRLSSKAVRNRTACASRQEEQGCPARSKWRNRYHVRSWDIERGACDVGVESGVIENVALLLLWRYAPWARERECQGIPDRKPGHLRRDRISNSESGGVCTQVGRLGFGFGGRFRGGRTGVITLGFAQRRLASHTGLAAHRVRHSSLGCLAMVSPYACRRWHAPT